MMDMHTKQDVINAIYDEWAREYGSLSDTEEAQKERFYFMVGFVLAAIENKEKEYDNQP